MSRQARVEVLWRGEIHGEIEDERPKELRQLTLYRSMISKCVLQAHFRSTCPVLGQQNPLATLV